MSNNRQKDVERVTRTEEARELESRYVHERPEAPMSYRGNFWFDDTRKPVDMEYLWAREMVRDIPDRDRIPELYMQGWTPVPMERHPEFMMETRIAMGYGAQKIPGTISVGGLMLMERSKVLCQQEKRQQEESNMRILQSLPGSEHFRDPKMPGKVLGRTINYGPDNSGFGN